jgi:beta-glucanase (GH16 family)
MVKNSVKRMTHILTASVALTLTAVLVGCGGAETNTDIVSVDTTSPVEDWVLVWSDEFDGASIDTNKWSHEVNCEGGGNFEQQCYTDSDENSFVSDGMLNIVAKPSTDGEQLPYTSARMVTKNKGDWTYGRFEIRAKLPYGQGTWPAFWMLSTDEVYGSWPKSGEIDIMEAVNLKEINPAGEVENSTVGQLYYGTGGVDQNGQFTNSGTQYDNIDGSNPANDFHTYSVEWQEGEIRWYVDGYLFQTQMMSEVRFNSKGQAVGLVHRGWFAEYYDIISGNLETQWDAAPFDQDFHILLNLAVGGAYAGNVNNAANFTNGIDPAAFENGQTYEIDYVRVYECASNPLTGAGCETIRNNYKVEASEDAPTGALVLGKAPTPTPPTPEFAVPITIFDDAENPLWSLWDSSGNTVPAVVQDDAEHGAVAEFSIINNDGAVLGFNSRTEFSDNGVAFNAAAMLTTGSLSFEMKVVSQPTDSTVWTLKVEGDNNTSFAEVALNTSDEGFDPVQGDWQTYTFSLSDLTDAGLDISAIDVIMIFPAWGTGEGAIYRVDNVTIAEPDGGSTGPSLAAFNGAENPLWSLWDSSGSGGFAVVDDPEEGAVAEFSISGNAGTVLGFNSRADVSPDGVPFDASSLLTTGTLSFDMKVVTAPADGTPWILKLEAGGNTSNSGDIVLNTSQEGIDPVTGVWQTYTFDLIALSDAGLDLSVIDLIMMFPAWGSGDGAVYRINNVSISGPSNGSTAPRLVAFEDVNNPLWSLWDSSGSNGFAVVDDSEKGAVSEFSVTGNAGTVLGYNSRADVSPDGVPFDASSLLTTGTLSFDMKVVTAPADGTPWILKLEAGGNTSNSGDIFLNTSQEGLDPVTGVWQTYTFSVLALSDTGLDISEIDLIMVFPAWGSGDGAIYRIDNVVIGN